MPATSVYPAQIDNTSTLPVATDLVTPVTGSVTNALRTAIVQMEMTLGVNPASIYSTVRNRLDVLENAITSSYPSDSISFNGDLTGTNLTQTVIGLYGNPISSTHPNDGDALIWNAALGQWHPQPGGGGGGSNATALQGFDISPIPPITNQVLQFNGSEYIPTTITATLIGDITGNISSNTISQIHGVTLSSTSPVQSAVIVYDTSGTQYDIRQLTLDDIGPAFAITSFTGGSVVEIGATVTNPTFTASYASAASSAHITNTDGIDSPLVLSTPYTSGTVVGSFAHTAATSVTFTLTASAATTKTATQSIAYEARMFTGTGATGATSTVTASGNTAILSTGDILANGGLSNNPVGSVYTLTPTGSQKFYLLLIGGSHLFKDNNTGFGFPFNSPTAVSFTNQHSAVITMYLYESTSLQNSSFNILVAN